MSHSGLRYRSGRILNYDREIHNKVRKYDQEDGYVRNRTSRKRIQISGILFT